MNMWRCALCLIAITMLTCASGMAEDVDGTWRPPPVGTKITYDDGTSREVVRVDGKKVHYRGDRSTKVRNVEWYSYMEMITSLTANGKTWRFDGKAIAKLFPLKVGNKSTVNARLDDWRARITFKVTAVREVETPLGVRTVFKIRMSTAGIHGGYFDKRWGYYDPALGIWYRGDWEVVKGGSGKGSRRVTKLQLPR